MPCVTARASWLVRWSASIGCWSSVEGHRMAEPSLGCTITPWLPSTPRTCDGGGGGEPVPEPPRLEGLLEQPGGGVVAPCACFTAHSATHRSQASPRSRGDRARSSARACGNQVSPPPSGVLRYMKKVSTRGPCGAQTAVFWSWWTL
jgi:hypothetical protein